jgi:sugar phosphate isomerase/epimerase
MLGDPEDPMTRRQMMQRAGTAAAWFPLSSVFADTPAKQFRNLGGAPAGFPMRSRSAREANKPFDFVEHCHNLGFGVVETRLNSLDPEATRRLRGKAEAWNLRVILDIPLPRTAADVVAFDGAVKAAKEAGAFSLHTAMTQRRYEQFDALEAFKKDFERCQNMIALAEPVLRKNQVRLGIENHKGWRSAEQTAWLKRLGSEWVGVHFDFGNNVALCEEPAETLRTLLPYVVACHLKDMAVEPYEDGFLLSEVPLGDGFLDIQGMVETLQKKDANMPFDLEMITRDPLKIPVFTEKYWATFDDFFSPLPGRDLAKVLNIVRKNKPKSSPPRTTGMSVEAQLQLEDENIRKSVDYARQHLNL